MWLSVVTSGRGPGKVSVIDDGIGIPQEALAKLFDPFDRVRQSTMGAIPKRARTGLSDRALPCGVSRGRPSATSELGRLEI